MAKVPMLSALNTGDKANAALLEAVLNALETTHRRYHALHVALLQQDFARALAQLLHLLLGDQLAIAQQLNLAVQVRRRSRATTGRSRALAARIGRRSRGNSRCHL